MPDYHEAFKVGEEVRIAPLPDLEAFHQTWHYHHPLSVDQLVFASRLAAVFDVSFYHGGDPLYSLSDAPGTWHERCLRDPTLGASPPGSETFWLKEENRNGKTVVVIRDTSGKEHHVQEASLYEGDLKSMSEVLRIRSTQGFASRYRLG
jgi:hypothetical protein